MIELSNKASEYINKFNENKEEYFRVAVVGGGCSGLSYKLGYTNTKGPGDTEYNSNGVKVLVDFKSSIFLEYLIVDYSDGLNGKGFIFDNATAAKSCGCGTSFSV
jgi:iron-sulfur cluster assembly protein